jgi:hypothetical protein
VKETALLQQGNSHRGFQEEKALGLGIGIYSERGLLCLKS